MMHVSIMQVSTMHISMMNVSTIHVSMMRVSMMHVSLTMLHVCMRRLKFCDGQGDSRSRMMGEVFIEFVWWWDGTDGTDHTPTKTVMTTRAPAVLKTVCNAFNQIIKYLLCYAFYCCCCFWNHLSLL